MISSGPCQPEWFCDSLIWKLTLLIQVWSFLFHFSSLCWASLSNFPSLIYIYTHAHTHTHSSGPSRPLFQCTAGYGVWPVNLTCREERELKTPELLLLLNLNSNSLNLHSFTQCQLLILMISIISGTLANSFPYFVIFSWGTALKPLKPLGSFYAPFNVH